MSATFYVHYALSFLIVALGIKDTQHKVSRGNVSVKDYKEKSSMCKNGATVVLPNMWQNRLPKSLAQTFSMTAAVVGIFVFE